MRCILARSFCSSLCSYLGPTWSGQDNWHSNHMSQFSTGLDMEERQGSSKHVIHIIELALCVLGHGNGKNVGPSLALKLPVLGPELAKQLHAMQPAVGAAAAVGRTSAIASCIPPAASPVAPTVADVLPSFFPLLVLPASFPVF